MVVKDMPLNENLTMENNRSRAAHSNTIPGATFRSRRRHCKLSLTTGTLLVSFFICTVVAVGFIVYNFANCASTVPPGGENVVCTTVHLKQKTQSTNDGELDENGNPRNKQRQRDVRLPRAVRPLKYNITLLPRLHENFTFSGESQIRVLIIEDCYNITLHAAELNITKNDVAVYRRDSAKMKPLSIRKQYLLEAKQFFVIELYDKLLRGYEYEIYVKFNGHIKDYLQGFYRSSYQVGNETRWLASTQFQATDARRAFPCFDEPALKANFTLHIARMTNMTTISNMPIASTTKHEYLPNYVWDHYMESLPMSTYLVAYAITDFEHKSIGNFTVWARAEAINSTNYALAVGPKILKFLESFFDLQFPLPKMDMIAIPDFQAGAMENWGLITYRETSMLFEEGISTATNKQRIANVVGHELAHQWFGNLVTPSWWTDIWLNEGFASYMEYLTVDAIEPHWQTLDQFVVNELQNVFQLDALSTSHKISVEVFNPDDINEIFDRISYAKGSTIIRMMNHFLTTPVFRKGLSAYLKKMAYNSATQDDLWRFLTDEAKASGLLDSTTTVKQIMDTWTLQMGYPVLHISRHPNSQVVRLVQERFVYTNGSKTDEKPLWWIPITYTTSEKLDFTNTRPTTWIPRTRVYEIENQELSTAKWFIFNIQQTGYYRVNYDLDNWKLITAHLMNPTKFEEVSPANRAQLIDDVLNLARGSYLNYSLAMNLTRYLAHELNHVPWKAAITNFNFIDSMLVNQGDYDLFKNYLLKLLTKVYNEVGFEDSSHKDESILTLFKRFEILSLACHLGHDECIAESSRYFQNWIQSPNPDVSNPISPNLRGIVYCTAIQYGTEAEWNFAFERYLKTSASTEKELLLTALGCSKEPWILFRYLRRSIAGKHIRKQDLYRVFGAVSSNVVGQQIAFDFLRNNWIEIKSYLGSSMSNLYSILKFATKRMNTKFQLAELETFVQKEIKAHGLSIQQIIEQVQTNINWMYLNYKTIIKWLEAEANNTQ